VAEFNFTDPVQTVFMNPEVLVPGEGDRVLSRKGETLDRDVFNQMRTEFYQLRGWDPATGRQTAAKLDQLKLSDLKTETSAP
jgi:aldehyde:ferredoxin oxidoreductase